jgi:hypothetical protein
VKSDIPEGFYANSVLFYPNLKKYRCIKDLNITPYYKYDHNKIYYGHFLEDKILGDSIVMHTHNSFKEGCGLKFSILEKHHCIFYYLNDYFIDISAEERKRKLIKLKSIFDKPQLYLM